VGVEKVSVEDVLPLVPYFTHPIKEDVKKKVFPSPLWRPAGGLHPAPSPSWRGFWFWPLWIAAHFRGDANPVDGFQVMVSSLRGRLTPIRCEATQARLLAFSANHHPI
jgi:hypothetical protein